MYKTTSKTKTTKYLRLPLDSELEKMLASYEAKYKFLNRVDIIKMLLSEINYSKNVSSKRLAFVSFINSLPKAKQGYSEDEAMKLLEENDLI